MSDALLEKIVNHNAAVGIIGLGYVGLPLSLAFCSVGFNVVGFDVDEKKCAELNAGRSYIKHIPSENISVYVEEGLLSASSDFSMLEKMDVVIICVPTPLSKNREPDLSYVQKTTEVIAEHCSKDTLVVLESSTYPGTTDDILHEVFSAKGFEDGRDIFIAYSPEREDPSNPDFTTRTIPKVVGANDDIARALSIALYEQIIDQVVPVSSSATAEAVKLTENIFRSVNIALVNELKVIYDEMGIDVWEVVEAASTKPFGYMPFYPGPGLGGHCIPIDPFYLTWKAREHEISTRFIELAGEINTAMPRYVVSKLADALGERFQKSVASAKVLILGVAYKKNLDDDRMSPAYKIIELLEDKNAEIDYHDPHIPMLGQVRNYPHYKGRKSVDLTKEQLRTYDAVVVCTAHDCIDWALVSREASLIIDTRNVMLNSDHTNVVKA